MFLLVVRISKSMFRGFGDHFMMGTKTKTPTEPELNFEVVNFATDASMYYDGLGDMFGRFQLSSRAALSDYSLLEVQLRALRVDSEPLPPQE